MALEASINSIGGIIQQPVTAAAHLLARLDIPQSLISLISKNETKLSILDNVVKVLVGAGILSKLNRLLSERALNNAIRDPTWDWKKEIVLVTGGSNGIGEQIVRKFAERDITLVILDITAPKKSFLTKSNIHFYNVNVTSPEAIHEAAQKIRQEVGDPTVLINNAGVCTGQTILDATEEQLIDTFNVNVLAHYWLTREFLPYMIEKDHGHVVTMASMASFIVPPSMVDYGCTKAAVHAFHEGLTQELKSRYHAKRVRTTIVHPLWVRTTLVDNLLGPDFNGPVMEAETVADAVVKQVLRAESAQLILPPKLSLVSGLRGWPSWLQEYVRADNSPPGTLELQRKFKERRGQ